MIYTLIFIILIVGISIVVLWLNSQSVDLIGDARRGLPSYDGNKVRCLFGGCQKILISNKQLEKVIIPEKGVVPDKVSSYKESGEKCETHEECKSKTCTKPVDQLMSPGYEKYCAYLSEEIAYWLQSGKQTQVGNFINQNLKNIPTQGKTNENTLKEISKWIHNNIMDNVQLSDYEKGVYTADEYVSNQFDAQGCTDFGIIFATFARAKGFPTILVGTYQLAYLNELEQGNKPNDIPGHFFANVYFNGKWHVYNPTNQQFPKVIYGENCVEDESLPGPEGCYMFVNSENNNLGLEFQKYVVVNKGFDFWDMYGEGSCIADANNVLWQEYDIN